MEPSKDPEDFRRQPLTTLYTRSSGFAGLHSSRYMKLTRQRIRCQV
ncbi:hypothetical protein RvY_05901 [Ramazzottius varieornatus]|uniref:Uncharacterized protein n=1 Tax=Ramazzottius varieornatus TaxID=947166 RepID=A0A1D1UZM7_RAMVA|nr:hypothetical protein RvY_05901 [Ramazzottius varieornatus]